MTSSKKLNYKINDIIETSFCAKEIQTLGAPRHLGIVLKIVEPFDFDRLSVCVYSFYFNNFVWLATSEIIRIL